MAKREARQLCPRGTRRVGIPPRLGLLLCLRDGPGCPCFFDGVVEASHRFVGGVLVLSEVVPPDPVHVARGATIVGPAVVLPGPPDEPAQMVARRR